MKRVRGISVILLCAMLLAFLPQPVFAMTPIDVDASRFMCDVLYTEDNTSQLTDRGSVKITFRGSTPRLRAEVTPRADAKYGNAIRIVLANDSYCNMIAVAYVCDGQVYEQRIAIDRQSPKKDYFLYVQNAGAVTDVHFAFYGGTTGTIELFGMDIVSVYNDDVDQPGEVTECTYNSETKTVTVVGNIRHETISAIRGATIALYSFGVNDRVNHTLLAAAHPIATQRLSSRFEFSVYAASFSERFAQYVVAIVSEEGEILYWYTPTVPCTPAESWKNSPAFKGAQTTHGALAASADVGFAVVDVYLNRMQSEKNNGFLHTADGGYFYINRAYVNELDEQINQFVKDGCPVYLRFLLDGGSEYNVLHGSSPASASVTYNGISLSGDTARQTLFAYTDFLCRRYAGSDKDAVGGIILGYAVDCAAQFNYVGEKTLAEYTETYSTALYVISEALHKTCPQAEMVVSLSDRYDSDGSAVSRDGTYPARLFLLSLCKMLQDRMGGALPLRVMIESGALPSILEGRSLDYSVASADNLSDWETDLRVLSGQYEFVNGRYFYCWRPDGTLSSETLSCAYVYTYYRLAAGQADGLVIAPDNISDFESLRSLFDTIKYVNTKQGMTRNQSYLVGLGVASWSALIPNFDTASLITREIHVSEADSSPVASIRGSYVMWDSQQGRNAYDWSASADCSSIHVNDVDGFGRSLVVSLSGEESYSEIVYAYSAREVMAVVDMLSADIMIQGEPGREYELVLELSGARSACITKTTVTSGEKATLHVSTLELGRDNFVRNIRLFCSPVGGEREAYKVCVSQLVVHSTSLDDEALAQEVNEARLSSAIGESADEEQGTDERSWKLSVGIVLFVLCVSAAIVFALARRDEE